MADDQYPDIADGILKTTQQGVAPVPCRCRLGCTIWWCVLAQPDEYDWTVRVRWQCGRYIRLLWRLVIVVDCRPTTVATMQNVREKWRMFTVPYSCRRFTLITSEAATTAYWQLLMSAVEHCHQRCSALSHAKLLTVSLICEDACSARKLYTV